MSVCGVGTHLAGALPSQDTDWTRKLTSTIPHEDEDAAPEDAAAQDATPGDGVGEGDEEGQAGGDESNAAAAPQRSSFRYMPGLDGLRGIGVALMLAYHLDVRWIGDGAVFTVEMFFALSGYLIVSLFIGEHRRNGRLDLRRFWSRRARRLLPATYLIFIPVAIYMFLWAPVSQLAKIRGDGISVLLYVSNWRFIFSDQSYFELFTVPSPFKAMWSLAIEEQFYIFVAIALYFGLKKWGPERRIWPVLAFGAALASAIWMAVLIHAGNITAQGGSPFGIDPASIPGWLRTFLGMSPTGDPSRVYYGTDTRMQGLMIGVGMAFILSRVDLSKLHRRWVEIISIVGIGGMLTMFLAIQGRGVLWIYSGGFLLFDLFMVLVIIALAAPSPPTLVRWASWKPIVFVGVLSYSLYVWHLPIFVMIDQSPISNTVRGWPLDVLKLAVVSLLAYGSYRLVEDPIRRHGLGNRQRTLAITGAVAALVMVFLAASVIPANDSARSGGLAGGVGVKSEPGSGSGGKGPVIYLNGDSMPWTLGSWASKDRMDAENGVQIYTSSQMGCGVGHAGSVIKGSPVTTAKACNDWETFWTSRFDVVKPDAIVVLAWGWEVYDRWLPNGDGTFRKLDVGTEEWRSWFTKEVQSMIDLLAPYGAPIFLTTLPCLDAEVLANTGAEAEAAELHRVPALNRVLADVSRAEVKRNVHLLDLYSYLCDEGRYRADIDGVHISTDGRHFTEEGTRKVLEEFLLPEVTRVLNESPGRR